MRAMPRIVLRILAAVVSLVVLFSAILILPFPARVTRGLVLACDDWILSDYNGADAMAHGAVLRASRRFLANLLEYKLICRLRQDIRLPPQADDAQRVVAVVSPLKSLLLNQTGVPHSPSSWPIMISGLGWCDQLNGVAAKLLAGYFPVTQIYALYDPVMRVSPHTVGRVWSKQYADWLYFDIFYEEVVCFRKGARGHAEILARAHPIVLEQAPESDEAARLRIYGLFEGGWVINEYRKTFAGYLLTKLRRAIGPRPQLPQLLVISDQFRGLPPPRFGPATRPYLQARLDHILGRPELALRTYADLAERYGQAPDPSLAVAGRAAERFVEVLGGDPSRRGVSMGP